MKSLRLVRLLVFLDLHAEVGTVFRDAVEAVHHNVEIICPKNSTWCDLRMTKQVKCCFVELEPFPSFLWVLLHQVSPKYVEKDLAAIEIFRPHIWLSFARLRDNLVLGSGLL